MSDCLVNHIQQLVNRIQQDMEKHVMMFSESRPTISESHPRISESHPTMNEPHPTIQNRITYAYMHVYIRIWCSILSRHFTRRVVWRGRDVTTYVHTCGTRQHMWIESLTLVHTCGTHQHMWTKSLTLVHTCETRQHKSNQSLTLEHVQRQHQCIESLTLVHTSRTLEYVQTHVNTCSMNHELSTVLLAWLLKHTHLIFIRTVFTVVTPFLSSRLWFWILGRRIAICWILNDQLTVDPD